MVSPRCKLRREGLSYEFYIRPRNIPALLIAIKSRYVHCLPKSPIFSKLVPTHLPVTVELDPWGHSLLVSCVVAAATEENKVTKPIRSTLAKRDDVMNIQF